MGKKFFSGVYTLVPGLSLYDLQKILFQGSVTGTTLAPNLFGVAEVVTRFASLYKSKMYALINFPDLLFTVDPKDIIQLLNICVFTSYNART